MSIVQAALARQVNDLTPTNQEAPYQLRKGLKHDMCVTPVDWKASCLSCRELMHVPCMTSSLLIDKHHVNQAGDAHVPA
ncbi:hypothetical protein GBA52_003475 [Prunus armeniaca]|nr:hypothetical protein GBA52_003475 [Prunus armeniaca]